MTKEQAKAIIENLVERFKEHRADYHLPEYNEQKTRQDFINPFFNSDLINEIIPKTNPDDVLNSCLMVTVLPDKSSKTIILFSCFDGDRQSEYFLKKLFSLNGDEFERAVTSIIVNNSSNVFLNPTMWDKLGARQVILENEINIKRPFDELPKKPFMSEINFFSNEFSAKELGIKFPVNEH